MTGPTPGSGWRLVTVGPDLCTWMKGRFVLKRYRGPSWSWSVHLVSSSLPGLMLSLTSDGRTSREIVLLETPERAERFVSVRSSYEREAMEEVEALERLERRWHEAERKVVDAQQPGGDPKELRRLDKEAHALYRDHGRAKLAIRPYLQELALSDDEILATVSGRR